jgi:hypothetical protein
MIWFQPCSRILAFLIAVLALSEAKAASREENAWANVINEQRDKYSLQSFLESTASGAAIFVIGTYGANFDKQGVVTSSVYSFLQTGGVLLMAQGIKTYLEASPVLYYERSFQKKSALSHSEFKKGWLSTIEQNRYAENVSDLFLWSSLGTIYTVAGFREPSRSATLRSVYFFLAANSLILASAAGYKLYSEGSASQQPGTSLSLVPASRGVLVSLEKHW